MSRVFVARDVALSRNVVVKVLAPELIQGLSVDRFTREIKLAAALQEPHIVPVLTAGSTEDGLPYYTMPFVEGESLRVRMQVGPVPVVESLSILRDVAKALAYAHARHIVHRDIKPENILLSSGTAVVTDFGIAKALQVSRTQAPDSAVSAGLTRTGTSLGTPAYMAPEQAAGDPATDQRADIYAWGVVAYELLAGQHPFASRTTPQQLLTAHMVETPLALGATASQASHDVMSLVMRCLEKDPAQRPQAAHDLLRVLDGESLVGARHSQPRVRFAAATAGLAAVLLAAAFSFNNRPGDDDEPQAVEPVMMAVLPFEHEGPADLEAFTAGLTDALTAKLGSLPSLAVIDRQSASQYRGTSKALKEIGTELNVQYLVVGVVRWATDGDGRSSTRVTPTLVDARMGTTKWTGEAREILLDDPFSVQTAVATDVARQILLEVSPAELAQLKRNRTENAAALWRYDQGAMIYAEAARRNRTNDPALIERAIRQFAGAIAIDSLFGDAWGQYLLGTQMLLDLNPTDSAVAARYQQAAKLAMRHAPENPQVLIALAFESFYAGDTTAAFARVDTALREGPKDLGVLLTASGFQLYRGLEDSAYALAKTARRLSPRSSDVIEHLAGLSRQRREWNEAEMLANALVALDSTDQRGWVAKLSLSRVRGDTAAVSKDLELALRHTRDGSAALSQFMIWSGTVHVTRFLSVSVRELGIASMLDSANSYYDNKLFAAARLGDSTLIHVYADSLRTMLEHRELRGPFESNLGVLLAGAQAILGDSVASRTTLERAIAVARRASRLTLPTNVVDGTMVAGVYARLGDSENAVRWLEAALPEFATVKGLLFDPRLDVLKGTPAMQRFLKAHPH